LEGGAILKRIGTHCGKFSPIEDPYETRNIAGQHPEVMQLFEAILKREHQPAHIRDREFVNPKFD
jgi:hypothetical protein